MYSTLEYRLKANVILRHNEVRLTVFIRKQLNVSVAYYPFIKYGFVRIFIGSKIYLRACRSRRCFISVLRCKTAVYVNIVFFNSYRLVKLEVIDGSAVIGIICCHRAVKRLAVYRQSDRSALCNECIVFVCRNLNTEPINITVKRTAVFICCGFAVAVVRMELVVSSVVINDVEAFMVADNGKLHSVGITQLVESVKFKADVFDFTRIE